MQSRLTSRATVLLLTATGLATAVPSAWAAGSPSPTAPPPPPAPSVPDRAGTPSTPATPSAPSSAPKAATGTTGATKEVSYRGYHAQVPKGWPVIDLAKAPRTCVRLDVSAVYLGTPGADQDCPAHLLPGKADGLLIEPVTDTAAAARVSPGAAIPRAVKEDGAASHQIKAQLSGTGLQVTASYGKSTDTVDRILASATVDNAGGPSAVQHTGTRTAATTSATMAVAHASYAATTTGPRTDVVGNAFDTCTAPSASAMQAWAGSSPYSAVGVYIGGPAQACAQPNLTPSWVSGRAAEGWSFLPIYVGHQASIGSVVIDADLNTARAQGKADASDAIGKASALGFGPGSVLYNDMENYNSGSRDRVLSYLAGWSSQLRSQGYRSGVYSSASSGVADLSAKYTDSSYPAPDVIWSAAWNSYHDVSDTGMKLPGPGYWPGGRRAHQHTGDTTESWGGVSMNIDGNSLDVTSSASDGMMLPAQRLTAGQSLRSSSMTLVMQSDGNLVAYFNPGGNTLGPPLWSTATYGNPGAYAVMQSDGNLVLYRQGGGPTIGGAIWSTATYGNPGAHAIVQEDGNLVVYRPDGRAVWANGQDAKPSTLTSGRSLTAGQWADAKLTRLIMQPDGNLVLYRKRDGAALWSTGTWGNPGARVTMQADGNLVVYRPDGRAIWSAHTWGNPGAHVTMQDDGNVVLYRQNGSAAWASGTWWNAS